MYETVNLKAWIKYTNGLQEQVWIWILLIIKPINNSGGVSITDSCTFHDAQHMPEGSFFHLNVWRTTLQPILRPINYNKKLSWKSVKPFLRSFIIHILLSLTSLTDILNAQSLCYIIGIWQRLPVRKLVETFVLRLFILTDLLNNKQKKIQKSGTKRSSLLLVLYIVSNSRRYSWNIKYVVNKKSNKLWKNITYPPISRYQGDSLQNYF